MITSSLAYANHERSGKSASNREKALKLVKQYPGKTCGELGTIRADMPRQELSRRLPELRKRGLIHNGKIRHCSFAGTKQQTWKPSEVTE